MAVKTEGPRAGPTSHAEIADSVQPRAVSAWLTAVEGFDAGGSHILRIPGGIERKPTRNQPQTA